MERQEAIVRTSVAGQITEMMIETPGRVLAPGEPIAIVTPPLSEIELSLQIPLSFIDQVHVGQTGLLTLPALPQRDAPRLPVRLTAIGDQPDQAPEGSPAFYRAEARLGDGGKEALTRYVGEDLRLSLGMPVSVSLEGREVTLLSYLGEPLRGVWARALQD